MGGQDKRVRIAVVGLNFGRHMITEIRSPAASEMFELAAVCDADAQKAARVAREFSVPAYNRLEALLEDECLQAVALFTGPVGRAALIRQIIRAGKHVMTTKPFELDAQQARSVLEEARALGMAVHLNSPSPLPTEDLRVMEAWRTAYDLGRPVACRCEVWASYRETADGSWYDDPSLCPVPPIYRLGIYLINDLIWLLGAPQAVSVMQSRIFTGRPTSDNAQIGILFRNQAIANIYASFCVGDGQPYRNALTMNFENGTLYRNVGPLQKAEPNRISVIAHNGSRQAIQTVSEHSGIYQWDAFYRAVRGDTVENDIERIVMGVQLIDAIRRAQETEGIVCLA